MHNKINRRTFAKQSAIFSAPLILPVAAKGANERLNIGVIGVGGKGGHNLAQVGGENVVAVCDVDRNRLSGAKNQHPKAVDYTDYRKLIERKDIDAVMSANICRCGTYLRIRKAIHRSAQFLKAQMEKSQ